jgi:hypothetical protein
MRAGPSQVPLSRYQQLPDQEEQEQRIEVGRDEFPGFMPLQIEDGYHADLDIATVCTHQQLSQQGLGHTQERGQGDTACQSLHVDVPRESRASKHLS